VTDGEPETAVSASLHEIKSIKNQHKHFILFFIFYFIKSHTIDSFVNHLDGHFSYLQTLDFSFKMYLTFWIKCHLYNNTNTELNIQYRPNSQRFQKRSKQCSSAKVRKWEFWGRKGKGGVFSLSVLCSFTKSIRNLLFWQTI